MIRTRTCSELTSPGGSEAKMFSSANSADKIILLLRYGQGMVLFHEDKKILNQALLQLKNTEQSGVYLTPAFNDGTWIRLKLSVAGEASVTAYTPGAFPKKIKLTPLHQAWEFIYNAPAQVALLKEWQEWATMPAVIERRGEALRRVTECISCGNSVLNLEDLGLSSLPTLPGMLTELNISGNQLANLTNLPTTLKKLLARNNQLITLPELPALTVLDICGNQLTNILPLPETLTELDASFNHLTFLEVLPVSLRKLVISYNHLTGLSSLPVGLISLEINNNQLTSLPTLPVTLTTLQAWNNQLTILPNLPTTLMVLNVCDNVLTALPLLPVMLKELSVNKNQLTTLPSLPATLTRLDVSNNQLTTITSLPAMLTDIYASNNRLTILPTLPSATKTIDFSNNPFSTHQGRPLLANICRWYPAEQWEKVCTNWSLLKAEDYEVAFTKHLNDIYENIGAWSPEFRQQVAEWLTELVITPELRKLSFALAQEAHVSCSDMAIQNWNNMQVARLLFKCTHNENTTTEEFISLARQVFRLQKLEQYIINKIHILTIESDTEQLDVNKTALYLGYQFTLKEILHLPDSLVSWINFSCIPHISEADLSIVRESINIAEINTFRSWLNNWEPCQQYLLKQLTTNEQEALTAQRIAMFKQNLNHLKHAFPHMTPEIDEDNVLELNATEVTNNTIFGPLIEKLFSMSPVTIKRKPTGFSIKVSASSTRTGE